MEDVLEAGHTVDQFWSLSLWEINMVINAYAKRIERQRDLNAESSIWQRAAVWSKSGVKFTDLRPGKETKPEEPAAMGLQSRKDVIASFKETKRRKEAEEWTKQMPENLRVYLEEAEEDGHEG